MPTPRLSRTLALTAALALLLTTACGDEDLGDRSSDTPPGTSAGTNAPPSTPGQDSEVHIPDLTWHADIAPLMDQHCTTCHYYGGPGVGAFTDLSMVRDFSSAIIASVDGGRMPPPVSDPECRDYHGADRWVPPADFSNRVASWVRDGAPEGDPSSRVEIPPVDLTLPNADLSLHMPAAQVPDFGDSGNEYRCFVLEHGRDETFYINAFNPIIDQAEIVHHVLLFKERRDRVQEHHFGEEGYRCFGMSLMPAGGPERIFSGDAGLIGGWAPGSPPARFEEGAGIRVDPDHVFIMQIHYFDSTGGNPPADRSGYAFETAPEVETEIIMYTFGVFSFSIPAGAEDHSEEAVAALPVPVRVHGVIPHMHVLGSGYHMWFGEDAEDQCLASSDGFDFDHQLPYMFTEPLPLPAGTQVGFRCRWNNSTSNPSLIHNPPRSVGFGTNTDQEMCFAFTFISVEE